MLEDLQLTSSPDDLPTSAAAPTAGTRSRTRRNAQQPHLRDYFRVIVKRRHVASAAAAVIALSAIIYAFTATPIYEGRAQLLIEADDPNVIDFKQVTGEQVNASTLSRQDYYQTQYRLLQSRSVAKKTIETLKLWANPELDPGEDAESLSLRAMASAAGEWVGSLFSSSTGATVPEADETMTQAKVIDAFLERLKVSPVRNSRLAEVTYRSEDPALAARVANTVAASYIDMNLDFRFTATREASVFLEQQLTEQRKGVETAEVRLQQYREQNDALSLEDRQNIVVQKLADLNAAVTRAKTERLQKESMYHQLVEAENDPDRLATFPAREDVRSNR